MINSVNLVWYNENTFTVAFFAVPSVGLTHSIAAYQHDILRRFGHVIIDCVPAYDSLMIVVDPLYEAPDRLAHIIVKLCQREPATHRTQFIADSHTEQLLSIPVLYDKSVAPDLQRVADSAQLACDEVIELHTREIYTVCALGFAPGFPYLGFVDSRIALPRLATPRRSVPEGAVGIADNQTGIYPRQSPGGWNIIGRTPVKSFDITYSVTRASLFSVGQRVRFYPISQVEYDALSNVGSRKAHASALNGRSALDGEDLV